MMMHNKLTTIHKLVCYKHIQSTLTGSSLRQDKFHSYLWLPEGLVSFSLSLQYIPAAEHKCLTHSGLKLCKGHRTKQG